MLLNSLQYILSPLVLSVAVHAVTAPTEKCIPQGWVRAPDLRPNTIVSGDAKVKINAGCPVEKVLGLRLKERSFIKALRSPKDRELIYSSHMTCIDHFETPLWMYPSSHFANRNEQVVFYERLAQEDLWMVREEERVVFETTQSIHIPDAASPDHDIVQNFSILVPSTNFPPALDYMNQMLMPDIDRGCGIEIVNVEFKYEYFVRVSFANGTTQDVSAGFTGFQPLYDPAETPRKPTSEAIELKSRYYDFLGKDSPTAYTARINTTSGLVFSEGFENPSVVMVISRTGPARTFTRPLAIRACIEPKYLSKWAIEYGAIHSTSKRRPVYVLRSTFDKVDQERHFRPRVPCQFDPDPAVAIHVTMPNPITDEIEAGEVVTTTSDAVTVPVQMDRRQVTDFETYYQTLSNTLQIVLDTFSDEVDQDDPSAEFPFSQAFEDNEEWVPWEKPPGFSLRYSGAVPAVLRPMDEVLPPRQCVYTNMDALGQAILSDEARCDSEWTSLNHYLNAGARGPVFVDRSTVEGLLAEDPAERDRRAPILQPVVSSPPEGDERISRYYTHVYPGDPQVYVGETWARKVANRRQNLN